MPLRVDGVVIPFLIALAMIGALAGVLRWTFGGRSGLRTRGAQADTAQSTEEAGRPSVLPPSVTPAGSTPGSTPTPASSENLAASENLAGSENLTASEKAARDTPDGSDTRDTRRRGAPDTPNTPTGPPDDFGLLATVAVVATVQEAEQIRTRLRAAGIRATTAPGPHGRYRVLVFETEIHRARRLGGSTT